MNVEEYQVWIKRRRKRRLRILAAVLCVCVLFTTFPEIAETLSVLASGRLNNTNTKQITAFAALPEEVHSQTVFLGTGLDELMLPDTIEAVLEESGESESMAGSESELETESMTTTGGERDPETEGEAEPESESDSESETIPESEPEVESESVPESATKPESEPEIESEPKTESESVPESATRPESEPEIESEPKTESESAPESATKPESAPESIEIPKSEPEAENEPTPTAENDREDAPSDTDDTQNVEIRQESRTVMMPLYGAENEMEILTLQDTQSMEESTEGQEETDNRKTVAIECITWKSDPEYDKDTEGIYLFTPILPECYVLAEGVCLPEITVTVESEDDEQIMKPFITGWHFGEEDTAPKGDLLYDAGVYSLILAGGDDEVQIPFTDITSLLPQEVTVELTYDTEHGGTEPQEMILPIAEWSCAEYVEDEEGKLPYSGEFLLAAELGAEETYTFSDGVEPISVTLVFDAPATTAAVTPKSGVITSDQEWGPATLRSGTYTINPGVTVTLLDYISIAKNANVTINGGGRIVRASSHNGGTALAGTGSMFCMTEEGGTLTFENITVDGNNVESKSAAIYVERGTFNLNAGAVIQNSINTSYVSTHTRAHGGGIWCGYNGIINIDGGIIRNCHRTMEERGQGEGGGGIYLIGTCNMTSGSITGNGTSGEGGAIYLSADGSVKLNLLGGNISGNSAVGNGDGIYYSTRQGGKNTMNIGGDANIKDTIYLDNTTAIKYPYITSALHYPVTLSCSSTEEGRVLAEGSNYTLTGVDASKIRMKGTGLYSRLDAEKNQIYLSATEEPETAWQESAGGAWKNGKFTTALTNVYDGGTIKLLTDIVISETAEITKSVTITSDNASDPYVMTRMPSGKYGNISITGNGHLTLTNVIYDGNRDYLQGAADANTQSLIKVGNDSSDTGARLTLGNGAVVRGGYKTGGSGLFAVYGTMTMNSGAVIETCEVTGTGGGVWVSSSGTFTMNGGTIRGCKAGGGGSALSVDGTCTLKGGSITDNTDTSDMDCAVYLRSSGSGKLTLSGTSISGNTYSVYNDGKSVSVTGNSTLSGSIYTTNAITASGNAVSSLTKTYTITQPDPPTAGAVVVKGSKDTQHYQLANTGYGLAPKSDGSSNLVAAKKYKVSFDNKGGTGDTTAIDVICGGVYGQLPTPTRTGYTFGGWYTAATGGSKVTANTVATATAAHILYAHWKANTYTVTYNKNSGTITNESSYTKYTCGTGLTLPTPARTGYTFGGWFENASFTGTAVTKISTTATGNKTYYAKWTAKQCKVVFDYQGATSGSSTTEKTVTYNSTYGTLPAPKKTGYTFKGWYAQAGGQGGQTTATTKVTKVSNHTLFAYWKDETLPDAPVLQDGVSLPTGWTNTQDSIPLKLYDSVGVTELWVKTDSGVYQAINGFSSGSSTYSYTVKEGEHTYQFKAKDAVGNESADSTVFKVKLDKTIPVINLANMSIENGEKNLWDWIVGKKSMIIKIPAADITDAGSGIDKVSYTAIPDSGAQQTKTISVKDGCYEIALNAEFAGTIELTAKDMAGNTVQISLVAADGKIVTEDNAPVVTMTLPDTPVPNANGWYHTPIEIGVRVTDNSNNEGTGILSGGIGGITWKDGEDGVEQTVSGLPGDDAVYEKEFVIQAATDGAHTYYINAVDNAGNESGWQTITVCLDTVNPVFRENPIVTNCTQDDADITFTSSENGKVYWIADAESKPDAQKVLESGSGNGNEKDITGGIQETFTEGKFLPGTIHTVYMVLEDVAGNLSEVKAVSFTTLQAAPQITLEDLDIDLEAENVKLPDDLGEMEIYTDPSDPEGSIIIPNEDGSWPIVPGTSIYIRYPEKTEGGITNPPSGGTGIDLPDRPAAPAAKQAAVTDTTVTVIDPVSGEEYVLVPKGQTPDWSISNTTGQFEGLDPNTEYDLYARIKATEERFASVSVKTEVRTSVTIKEPVVTGNGAGEEGNTVSKPDAPDTSGSTVTYTGTYEEEYVPVIIVDGQEYSPEMTWNEDSGDGEWEYTLDIPDGAAEVEITVEFRKRTISGIMVMPETLTIFADNDANVGITALTSYLKENSSVQAVYDNKTNDTVQADYSTKDDFSIKGAAYNYTVSASGKTSGMILKVAPVTAAFIAPAELTQVRKDGGYTVSEVAGWLPAQVTVNYTGEGYIARTESSKVVWDTDSIEAGFGSEPVRKTISGTVELPAWVTCHDSVSIVIDFIDKLALTDAQMKLSVSGWVYGEQAAPVPQGSIAVADTNPSYTYLYSANNGAAWVTAENLPKSSGGHIIPGEYLVKMTYMGDDYVGVRTASFNVAAKLLEIRKGTLEVEDRNYDGTMDARLKEGGQAALSGVVTGDTVALGGSLSARFTEAGPKKKIPVIVTGFLLEGSDAGYYGLKNTTLTLYATINNADGTPPSGGNNGNGGNGNGGNSDNDGKNSSSDNGDSNTDASAITPPSVTLPTDMPQPDSGTEGSPDEIAETNSTQQTEEALEQMTESKNTDTNTPEQGASESIQADNEQQTKNKFLHAMQASIVDDRIVMSGGPVETGNRLQSSDTTTMIQAGEGLVAVTLVCEDEGYAAGVKDTIAVANAVLTPEQIQLVNDGASIEIKIVIKDISGNVTVQDKEIIENGLTLFRKEIQELTIGMYVDISMFTRVDEGDWNTITAIKEPIEISIGILKELQEDGRTFYIIRSHEGEYTLLNDVGHDPNNITIRTNMFSAYAIAYRQKGMDYEQDEQDEQMKCRLCHICPTFLGICYFAGFAMIIALISIICVIILIKRHHSVKK